MALMAVEERLNWDDTFGIVQCLKRSHPSVNFESLSLGTLCEWILALAEFDDDPSIVNDDILLQIFNTWYEEVNP
ncbi:MAG: Fe-S assembly protein IscX [Anaerolineae bacterium]|jgi:FeS assembly protein IscX|nr:MAG: Fe-S assembly protein IscX [Anaerolineae bacterium]